MRAPLETGGRSKSAREEADYLAWLKRQAETSEVVASAADDDDNDEDDDLVEDAGDWEEEKHPRVPAGQAGGGQFGAGGGGGPTHGREQPFGRVTMPRPPPVGHGTLKASMFERFETVTAHSTPRYKGDPVRDESPKFNAHEVIDGVKHEGLATWMKQTDNQPNLEVVTRIDGLGLGVEGIYNADGARIRVDGNAHASFVDVGSSFHEQRWGDTWSVATKASEDNNKSLDISDRARVQTNFEHELGHHVHLMRDSDPKSWPVNAIVKKAYADRGFGYSTGLRVAVKGETYPMFLQAAVLQGRSDVPNPAISRYAATNDHEYFAENFAAYLRYPDALKSHDPIGYQMVKDVLRERGIEK